MILLLLYFLSFILYYSNKKAEFLLCFIALTCSGFGFFSSQGLPFKISDLIIIEVVYITINERLKDRNYFNSKNDIFGKIFITILLYYLFEFIRTVVFKIDTPIYAFKVVRYITVLFFYFYLRKISYSTFEKLFHYLLVCSVAQGIFFYLQLFGIQGILTGRIDEAEKTGQITRYANFPVFSLFFTIYYVVKEKGNIFFRLFMIVFFAVMPVIGQTRSAIISPAIAIIAYFIIKRKIKYSIYIALGAIFFQLVVNPMFEYRDRHREKSTVDEIITIINNPTEAYNTYTSERNAGTFAFRIAMLVERSNYLADNPKCIPFGTGCIHEESPNNRFTFKLGTRNSRLERGFTMIGGADISWINILLLYGIGGIFLYTLLLYKWFKQYLSFVKDSINYLFISCLLYSITAFFLSFNSGYLVMPSTLIYIQIFMAIVYIYSKRELLNKGYVQDSKNGINENHSY